MLVAALHDTHERGDGFGGAIAPEQVIFDTGFATEFVLGIDDFVPFAGDDLVEELGGAMAFLSADDEVDIGQTFDQFGATTLGHAPHEAEDDIGAFLSHLIGEGSHFAEGLLFGHVADAAGIEENDIRGDLGRGEGIAF